MLKKFNRTRISFFLLVSNLFFIFPSIPAQAYSGPAFNIAEAKTASLYFLEASSTNEFLNLDLMLNPGGQAVNAIGTTVYYSPDTLSIDSLSIDGSACQLFIDRIIDNDIGSLTFSCGTPFPGILSESKILQITFKKKQTGWAYVDFTDSMALANDGYGTDILGLTTNQNLYISNSSI